MGMKNIADFYPLSPMQQGILFHCLADPKSGVYFDQFSCTIEGNLNIAAFHRAWQQVVNRHSILRTCFLWEGLKEPVQVVHRQVTLPFVHQDWRHLSSVAQQEQIEAFLSSDRCQGFNLTVAPLMRLLLIQLTDYSYHFIWSSHHLLLDGWSVPLIFQEVLALYKTFAQGQTLFLPSPRPYRDYIVWLQQQNLSEAETFWRQTLKGFTAPTKIGENQNNQQTSTDNYKEQQLRLQASTTAALQSLAQKHQLTLNTLVQGAWALLLNRYSGEADVLFGVTVSGRPAALPKAESMVGLFINTLPFRVEVDPEAFLLPWLKQVQVQQVETRQYEYSPLVEIQGWSEVNRGLPLFESILVFENYPVDISLSEPGLDLAIKNFRSIEQTNYPLTLSVIPGKELLLTIAYNEGERFAAATIERMLGHLATLLNTMVANPQQRLKELSLLTAAEKQQLLVEWNNTKSDYPQDLCIHQLFEAQVERTPDAVAVVFQDEQLTYTQLNQRANQLAHYLQKLGVKPEVLVGICLPRSIEMLVGLLAILKAGGAYVPIDPAYPQQRLALMLEDAQVSVLLTQQHLLEKLPAHQARVVCLDSDRSSIAQESQDNPINSSTANCLAYVIYTSGSTGKPKGVLGLHQGAVNRFAWMWQNYPFKQGEVCCQKTSLNFVDSVWEIFGPLLQGVRIVIIPDSVVKAPQQFIEILASNKITRLVVVPSLLRILLDTNTHLQQRLPQLQLWVTSGEALSHNLLQKFRQTLPESTLLNLYGSSEVSADVTCYSLSPQDAVPAWVVIGRPIANTQVYVLDRNLKPVPIGVPGEVYIGGVGLARGYFNRPEMTVERFIPNIFSALHKIGMENKPPRHQEHQEFSLGFPEVGTRLYKTGDFARYLVDGNLEFLGRIDNQVKIRGSRIELGEIEAALVQYSGVENAVVVAREDRPNHKQLVAYVVAQKEQVITVSELHRFLKEKLPDYMLPSAFVILETLPLLPNGKVDRHSLPAPDQTRPELETTYQPPQNDLEQTIANIWQEVLHVKEVGIYDNFFELGGQSLLLVQVHSKLQKILPQDLSLVEMFQYPTISSLAKYLSQEQNKPAALTKDSYRTEVRTASIKRRREVRQNYRKTT